MTAVITDRNFKEDQTVAKKIVATIAMAVMAIVTGCGTLGANTGASASEEIRSKLKGHHQVVVTNVVPRTKCIWEQQLQGQLAVAQQQTICVQQQLAVAQQQAKQKAKPQVVPATPIAEVLGQTKNKDMVVQIWTGNAAILHGLNKAKDDSPEQLGEDITAIKKRIKQIEDDIDDCSARALSTYSRNFIYQMRDEIEANKLALKNLRLELLEKMAKLKQLSPAK